MYSLGIAPSDGEMNSLFECTVSLFECTVSEHVGSYCYVPS
jgi:hypothetical protein